MRGLGSRNACGGRRVEGPAGSAWGGCTGCALVCASPRTNPPPLIAACRSAHKDMSAMTSIEASCSKLAAAQALNAAVPALNATAAGDVLRAVDPVTGAQGRRLLGALLALVRGR